PDGVNELDGVRVVGAASDRRVRPYSAGVTSGEARPGTGEEYPPYPVGLRLAGRPVVVVGGGQVAGRRVPALLAAGAELTIVSPSSRAALQGMAGAGELRWQARRYREGDLADAWYALAATDDPTVNAAVVAEADRRRIFCVRADDATQASAWTPASGRHDNVTVAVLSNRDPRRSAR